MGQIKEKVLHGGLSILVLLDRLANRGFLVVLAQAALIVVLGMVLSMREGPRLKSADEPAFFDLAGNLGFQREFSATNSPLIEGYDPALPMDSLRPTAYRAPGYAFFLAPFRLLGADYVGLRVMNFALVAATLLLLYRLLVLRYSKLTGLLGTLFVLAYPALFYAAGTLYPQTFAGFLLVASVFLLDHSQRVETAASYAWAGLVYALLILTVPTYLLLVPLVVGWLAWRRAGWARMVIFAGVLAAVVGCWSVRNLLALHAPVAVATSSGFNLLSGNGPNTRYNQASVDVRWPEYVYTELTGKGEVERDRILSRAAVLYITENPGRTAVLYVQKFLYWFTFSNELLSNKVVPGGAGAGTRGLRDVAMLLSYGPLLALLVVRLVFFWRRYSITPLEVLLLALYVGGGLAYAVYFTRIRFRLPFDWLLIALAAIFLARLLGEKMSGRSGHQLTLSQDGLSARPDSTGTRPGTGQNGVGEG